MLQMSVKLFHSHEWNKAPQKKYPAIWNVNRSLKQIVAAFNKRVSKIVHSLDAFSPYSFGVCRVAVIVVAADKLVDHRCL